MADDRTTRRKIPFDWKRTAIASLPFMGMISFWQVFDGLVPKMLTGTFGLDNTVTGVVMALDNIFGLFLLPWFGIMSDHCRSRLGRRTPYILAGSAVAAVAVPMIAVANNLLFFNTPQYGLLEQITSLLGLPSRNWLGDPATALACVTVVAVWKEAGFFMIFYLAALQTLNPSLKEAAAIEGASRWYFFRRVQWPLLMPTTLFVLVNAVINAFRLVDHLFILTRGGPDNASTLLLYHLYEVGFKFWDTGYAAAITVVLVVVLAGIALVQFFVLDRKVHYK